MAWLRGRLPEGPGQRDWLLLWPSRAAPLGPTAVLRSPNSRRRPPAPPPPTLLLLRRQLLGYVYPAYKTYKAVQLPATRSNDTLLRHWCTFWALMAVFTALQPLADTFIFWLPFYYEAKLAFAVYLWANGGCWARRSLVMAWNHMAWLFQSCCSRACRPANLPAYGTVKGPCTVGLCV